MKSLKKVIVIGATGLFGKLLCKRLATSSLPIELILCARNFAQLKNEKDKLDIIKSNHIHIKMISFNINTQSPEKLLNCISPDIIVNAAGPFQNENYNLIKSCVNSGIHYIDLADDEDFVFNMPIVINEIAKDKKVLAVSGASSVPCLSSAIFNHLKNEFSEIESVDIGISPGNQTPRGFSTVSSILSYTGKSFFQKRNGQMTSIKGWQNLRLKKYKGLGNRWLSNCKVPDTKLFEKYHPEIKTVRFQAGLELSVLHLGLFSLCSIFGSLKLEKLTNFLIWLSNLFLKMGSDTGAMHLEIEGIKNNKHLKKELIIIARNGAGPYIPTLASIILIKKILMNNYVPGAVTGFGLLKLQEFIDEAKDLDIEFNEY